MTAVDIAPLQYAQIRVTAEVLTRAFDDSPIMQYLMPGPRARTIGMRAFFISELIDAHKHGEAWVAKADGVVVGSAAWLPPGSYPPNWRRQARKMLHLLTGAPVGLRSLVRSLKYLRAVEAEHTKAEHWYLTTLGIDPDHQGRAHGARLLDAVLARTDEAGVPTYLETDKESNLAYYTRHRFVVTDQIFPMEGAPPTWTMWRDPTP